MLQNLYVVLFDCSCPFLLTGGMHDYILAHRNTTSLSSTIRWEAASFQIIKYRANFNEGVRLCPSCAITKQCGEESRNHCCTVQMNEVKFRAPSAHPRHPWCIRKVWWRWPLRQPRSALWVTESTRGKYWSNPSFAHRPGRTMCLQYYQMWCLCLACLGKWGPTGSFFGKYQISSPPASSLLHSQIQPDRVLPTSLRRGRNRSSTARLLYSLYK